ncbi:hypothetical protein GCM10011352_01460 [Marinobacterium zhoushanense]|uniref:HTH lysR-type domain-containing protein n=1 Tax=Marinobacterium zhoushanense TaxID=1679163 RepID=A0ABQ1K0L9_9GAMM|nr:LysR family transcriptional regulator [Marinobacterium zhoushanense]GGB79528.1 hypothetical protein GCM10011352_01460 [Marinobacterium zhoushanense]
MDPKHLLYLSVVLEKGSLTEAAKHLAVTQPTLTRIMSTLEMQAGGQLFSRSRYGVKATPVGEALAREGRAIQRNVEMAQLISSRFSHGYNQEIRIGVGPLLAATIIPEVINQIISDVKKTSLTINVYRPTVLMDKLMDGELDLVIAPAADLRTIEHTQRTLLGDDQLGIFCSRSHPLAQKKELTLRDFYDFPWLSLGHASPFERQVMEMLSVRGLSNIRTQLIFRNDGHMLLHILSQGAYLAVLPRKPIQCSLYNDQLVELELNTGLIQERNLYLWARDEFADHPLTQKLTQLFKEAIGVE